MEPSNTIDKQMEVTAQDITALRAESDPIPDDNNLAIPDQPGWDSASWLTVSSIRWKILVIALIAAVAFAAYLGFNLVQSNSQAILLEDIRIKRYPLQAKLQEGLFALRFIQAKMQDAVLTGEIESLEEVNELKSQFLDSIAAAEEIDPGSRNIVVEINRSFNEYYDSSYKLAQDLIRGQGDFVSGAIRGQENAKLYAQVVVSLDSFKAQELSSFVDAVNLVTERAKSIIEIGITVGLMTVVLLVALALLTSHWIIARINHIVKTLRNIAHDDGDMSVRIPVDGRDEMAELSFWFNQFIAKLEKVTNASTQEIRQLAFTDALTSLPNRRLFNSHLKSEILRAERAGSSLAVMFLDLDKFKQVNDQLGHEAGDKLVCEVARRLEQTVRGYDLVAQNLELADRAGEGLVARMGGDEFMLVISELGESGKAGIVAERVRQIILEPIEILGNIIEIGVSIGIAVYPENGSTVEELSVKADLAMYEAKSRGRNNFCFFSAELELAAKLEAETEIALRQAIDNNDLELFFQPKYDIKTDQVVGAEALLRWDHEELGSMSPAVFVPLAEASELIFDLDSWVFRNACKQIKDWRDRGLPVLPIAINVSAKQAAVPDLIEKLHQEIDINNLPPYSLEVEITETAALTNIEIVAENIRQLQALSVTVTLDDFGAGHSSLELLRYCKIDTLKIDRGFISELNQQDDRYKIIGAVIAMAKVLDVTVVAEGVEELDQLNELKKRGCNFAQGFLFARPMPVSKFEAFMQQQADSGKIVSSV